MAQKLTTLEAFSAFSDDSNQLIGTPAACVEAHVIFGAKNCVLRLGTGVKLLGARIEFHADNAVIEIGDESEIKSLIRCGHQSKVSIGKRLTCTGGGVFTAGEGVTVTVGDDCMFARNFAVRADDAHPIFDRATGKRLNPSQNMTIGDHVWLARSARVHPGGSVGEGSVIGTNAVVTKPIPANCIAVGIPARVTTRNIVWDKTHVCLDAPWQFDTVDDLPDPWVSDLPLDPDSS